MNAIKGLLIGSLLLCCSMAHAWNKAGHMVSGAIAYQTLKQESPETLAKVVAILKQHPQFSSRWQPMLDKESPADPDEYLFMLAARWPDDVRGTKDGHDKWHYVDFPYAPQPMASVPPPDKNNLLPAYAANMKIVGGTGSDARKAVALCWLFHLTGDAHQPLHAISLFTKELPPPEGDRGGNSLFVREAEKKPATKLHSLWDGLITNTEKYGSARNIAIQIRSDLPRQSFPEVDESDPKVWTKTESFEAAKTYAYLDGNLDMQLTSAKASVLPQNYLPNAADVANKRMALSGYRLADKLKILLP